MSNKKVAEFFAGIGLVRLGLERAGWQVAFANDISPDKFQIYKDNFGGGDFLLGDIHQIKADSVPNISLATASFPCIDLSLAGNRNGLSGRHSSAFWEFFRIIKEMGCRRPKVILIENVVGLLSSNQGNDLRSILSSLGKLGYFFDVLMIDAIHFTSQSRPRLFVIASAWCLENNVANLAIHEARPRQITEFIQANRNLRWSHFSLPPLPSRKHDLCDVVERLEWDSEIWWDRKRRHHLLSQMNNVHKSRLRELAYPRSIQYATVYKRVRATGCMAEIRTDGVAGCLRTPRGGSSKQFLIQAGFNRWEVRNLSAREYARLQGVPDSFVINCPYNQALHGFGDAVCVPVVEWIAKFSINTLFPN